MPPCKGHAVLRKLVTLDAKQSHGMIHALVPRAYEVLYLRRSPLEVAYIVIKLALQGELRASFLPPLFRGAIGRLRKQHVEFDCPRWAIPPFRRGDGRRSLGMDHHRSNTGADDSFALQPYKPVHSEIN
jgi:hypothetical protein